MVGPAPPEFCAPRRHSPTRPQPAQKSKQSTYQRRALVHRRLNLVKKFSKCTVNVSFKKVWPRLTGRPGGLTAHDVDLIIADSSAHPLPADLLKYLNDTPDEIPQNKRRQADAESDASSSSESDWEPRYKRNRVDPQVETAPAPAASPAVAPAPAAAAAAVDESSDISGSESDTDEPQSPAYRPSAELATESPKYRPAAAGDRSPSAELEAESPKYRPSTSVFRPSDEEDGPHTPPPAVPGLPTAEPPPYLSLDGNGFPPVRKPAVISTPFRAPASLRAPGAPVRHSHAPTARYDDDGLDDETEEARSLQLALLASYESASLPKPVPEAGGLADGPSFASGPRAPGAPIRETHRKVDVPQVVSEPLFADADQSEPAETAPAAASAKSAPAAAAAAAAAAAPAATVPGLTAEEFHEMTNGRIKYSREELEDDEGLPASSYQVLPIKQENGTMSYYWLGDEDILPVCDAIACKICLEKFHPSKLYRVSLLCTHQYCAKCIASLFANRNGGVVLCPGCKLEAAPDSPRGSESRLRRVRPFEDCERARGVVDPAALALVPGLSVDSGMQLELLLPKNIVGEGARRCPFCASVVVVRPNKWCRMLRCCNQSCGRLFCDRCGKTHLLKDCPKDSDEDRQTVDMMKKTFSRCPSCRTFVFHARDHGCHTLVCPNSLCRHMFCAICGKVARGTDELNARPTCRCPIFCTPDCPCKPCAECKPGKPCSLCDGCPCCAVPSAPEAPSAPAAAAAAAATPLRAVLRRFRHNHPVYNTGLPSPK